MVEHKLQICGCGIHPYGSWSVDHRVECTMSKWAYLARAVLQVIFEVDKSGFLHGK
jgi:hypothetical protein